LSLPTLTLPGIPTLAIDVPIPWPDFDFDLPSLELPGLPTLTLPGIPTLSFPIPIPAIPCPLD
jgi:hypothetical protein